MPNYILEFQLKTDLSDFDFNRKLHTPFFCFCIKGERTSKNNIGLNDCVYIVDALCKRELFETAYLVFYGRNKFFILCNDGDHFLASMLNGK